MQEARVQVETKEPISGEIRGCWFDLPIDTALFEEVLGIDAENDSYYITDKELPFADEVREDTTILELNELYEMYQRLPDGIGKNINHFLSTMKIWKNSIITETRLFLIQTARA